MSRRHPMITVTDSPCPNTTLLRSGRLIVPDPNPARPAPPRRRECIGLGAFGAALLSATYVLTQGSRWDWLEASRIGWMSAIAIAALLLFALDRKSTRLNSSH